MDEVSLRLGSAGYATVTSQKRATKGLRHSCTGFVKGVRFPSLNTHREFSSYRQDSVSFLGIRDARGHLKVQSVMEPRTKDAHGPLDIDNDADPDCPRLRVYGHSK